MKPEKASQHIRRRIHNPNRPEKIKNKCNSWEKKNKIHDAPFPTCCACCTYCCVFCSLMAFLYSSIARPNAPNVGPMS